MRASPSWWRSQTECVTLAARRQHQGAADAQAPDTHPPTPPEPEQISDRRKYKRTRKDGKKKGSTSFCGGGGGEGEGGCRCAPATCWNRPNIFTGLFYGNRHKETYISTGKQEVSFFCIAKVNFRIIPNCCDHHFQLIELKNHNIITHIEIYNYGQEGFLK